MALTVVPSTRVFNGNVGTQAYVSGSTGKKCHCCPYGYHIDLDFVRYCEAVAAGSIGDRPSIERRKKRERRRQCQSMEVLLGLVNPALAGIEAELLKIPRECTTANGVTTLPRSNTVKKPVTSSQKQPLPIVDLSDVVGDFEATLKRSCRPSKMSDSRAPTEIDGTNGAALVQNAVQTDQPGDSDNASIGSGNSNLSTGALQNIREQMAVSLERMKELEEQVKAIPMLQVQVSVLKEEKRKLLRQVDELSKTNTSNDILHRYRSYSEQCNTPRNMKNTRRGVVGTSTRDMGTMCSVMTRDIGISHRQVRTRDVGMTTSTPLKPSLHNSRLRIEEIVPEIENQSTIFKDDTPSNLSQLCDSDRSWKTKLTRSQLMTEEILPEVKRTRYLTRTPLQLESIPSNNGSRYLKRDFGTNTENRFKNLQCKNVLIEDIAPEVKKEIKKRSCGIITTLSMADVFTNEDMGVIVDDALRIYKSSLTKNTTSRSIQCTVEIPKVIEKRDQTVQVTEQFKMRSHVGITAKPRTAEVGVDVRLNPCTRTVGIGPDPIAMQPVSLNLMNSRSHSFNYGDTRIKKRATRSVAVMVDDLIKTVYRATDTSDLLPKLRDFGTSPMKKKLVDVSVGESVRPHISISCAANYCDNCKETIKSLAKQITNNTENSLHHQNNTSLVSRIPRPSHIPLNTSDHRRQYKRQDTYTKIPAVGVIRYDTDNKEQYDKNKRIQQQQSERSKDENIASEEIRNVEKKVDNEEKSEELPESALFQPIQDKPRKKVEPIKEMRAAMKVLNDNLKKSPSRNISNQLKNATNIIQQEWFEVSSTSKANPLDVEDYLDCFEEYSSTLLEYIVNMTDTSGNTAMHYAVSYGNFDIVSILLDSKVCDINKANVAGYTAVMLAALAEVKNSTHGSVANRLLQLADVNIRAKMHGQTALMLAVSHGRKDMTQLLLDAGAAVNIQDEDGSTALMCAAEHGHTDIVRLLLAHPDCDPSIVDVDGSSALKIALEAGNRDIGVLLYAHEHVNRGTSPYSTLRRSRRGSKPTTPTGPSPSAPVSPAPSRRFHSSTVSLNTSKYSAK